MSDLHGSFIWYELLTTSADGAVDFYGKVLGWSFADSDQPGVDYRSFSAGTEAVGGMMAINAAMEAGGAQPCWLGYIGVADVDTSVTQVTQKGGAVIMPAQDMAQVGRIAMVADPQGAPFYIMTPLPRDDGAVSTSFAADAPKIGHCAWNELSTTDSDAAMAFYTGLFGWTPDGDMDMGPLGKYRFLRHGDHMIGAIMPKMPQTPTPVWTYYFRVVDVDASIETIKTNGGTILNGPDEIPGGEFSLTAMDPQGAAFALVGPRIS